MLRSGTLDIWRLGPVSSSSVLSVSCCYLLPVSLSDKHGFEVIEAFVRRRSLKGLVCLFQFFFW